MKSSEEIEPALEDDYFLFMDNSKFKNQIEDISEDEHEQEDKFNELNGSEILSLTSKLSSELPTSF